MELADFLGKRLKDDDVLDLLEHYDIPVIYDFDRTHENMPDKYWAQARQHGFQLGFNEQQILVVVFCYVAPSEGFSPIDPGIIGAPVYTTFEEAERHCQRNSVQYRTSDAKSPGWWLRIEGNRSWTHYQFKNNRIFRVTISLPN
jgi:hypothetical protein